MGFGVVQASPLHGPHPALKQLMPPKCLHPNSRASWRERAAKKSLYSQDAKLVVCNYIDKHFKEPPQWKEVVLSLTFIFGKHLGRGRRQRHDPDNLIAWAKTPVDALTRGGLLEDDRSIIYLPPQQVFADEVGDVLEFVFWEGSLTFPPFAGG